MKYFFVLLLILFALVGYFSQKKYDYLIIENNSSETMNDVYLISSNTGKILIGNIYPASIYKYRLMKSQNETSISLTYTDSNKKNYEVNIIPYLILGRFKNYEYIRK